MLPVNFTGFSTDQTDDRDLQEASENPLLSQRSMYASINQSDSFRSHGPLQRRATIGTPQELSSSTNSDVSVTSMKPRSKTWYSGLMSGLMGTIALIHNGESGKERTFKNDFDGSAEDLIKVSIDRVIEFCPRGFRDKLLSCHIEPIRRKMNQENVFIGLIGQYKSGKNTLLGVIELSDLLQDEMKRGAVDVRLCSGASDQALLTCCAYMYLLSCDDQSSSDNIRGLQVLLERDKEIFTQRRLLFLANKLDTHLTPSLSVSGSISALSHTTTDTSEFSMYDRLKDIEDITDKVRREAMYNLSDTLGASIPDDCVHPCMLRWAHTARTVKTRLKSSNLPVEEAENAITDYNIPHPSTTHLPLDVSTNHSPLDINTTHSPLDISTTQLSLDINTTHSASGDHYIVDYNSDDVPVNHAIQSASSNAEQACIEDLQDWWNMYQPLIDVDEVNHLPLEEKIEFVSGISTIEKWISRHCRNSQQLKQVSILSDTVYCLQCCSEVLRQEYDHIISRIEKLQDNLQQKEQQYCDIANEYRLLHDRKEDVGLFQELIKAYDTDIEDACLIIEQTAEDLLKEFKLMCQQKIDKMKMYHVQWKTSTIQSILEPLQKDIKAFGKLCEMHLQSAMKRVAFPTMYRVLPLSTTKRDLKNLHEMAEMYTSIEPIHYELDTHCPVTPEVDHSGIYCLEEMFTQATNKWFEDVEHQLFTILYLESANYLPHHPKNNSEAQTPNHLELHEKEFKALFTKELTSESVKNRVIQDHMDEYSKLMAKYLNDFDDKCQPRMIQAKEEVIKEIKYFKKEVCITESRLKHLINLKVHLELHRATLYQDDFFY